MKVEVHLLRYGRVISNSALKRKNYGMDNSNRTSHCNVGHSIGSSGKTFEKTPGQRNSRTGMQRGLMHCSKTLSDGGIRKGFPVDHCSFSSFVQEYQF